MDEVFKRFIEKAKRHGLCKEYTDKVESAESKRAFMDIVLDANGMEWMCNAIAKWNALTPEYIADAFAPFNDGKYTHHDPQGYSSQMYCGTKLAITLRTSAALIINSDCFVHNLRYISVLYVVNSKIRIGNKGKVNIISFNSEIIPDGDIVLNIDKRM